MSVKIVIDSTVDMIPELKARTTVVPLTIYFGQQEFQDSVTITPDKFYEMLVNSEQLPTTSQPTPAAFADVYAKATADGSEVVVITIASQLSGTYQSATIAAEDYPGKVFVVDSRTAAIASGVLAEYALQLADQGKGGQQILEALIEKRKDVCLYAIVDTLEYLKKGGRLNSTVAFVGGLLNIKPIISVENGEIKVMGMARGIKKAFTTLTELSSKDGVDVDKPILLGYTGQSDEQLCQYMHSSTELWSPKTNVSVVGAAIGVHAGPGAVATAFFKK